MATQIGSHMARWSFTTLGILGGGFIAYGVLAAYTGETWKPLESVATPLSAGLTVLGAMITAASIYAFADPPPHPPDPISKYFNAWFVVLAGAVALVSLFRAGSLSPVIVNGFSMMAIAGGLLRMQPRPDGW